MRWQAITACWVAVVGMTIAACGSDAGSLFAPGGGDGGVDPSQNPPPGAFTPTGTDGDAGGSTCTPRTCADENANCGLISDGCGGVVQCGETCPAGEVCGGGGVPSQCGKPECKPATCDDLDVDCGVQPDGCGGTTPSCGTCNADAGEFCGGGGPSKCGVGNPGDQPDSGGVCTPKTCTELGADCGVQADGCGDTIDCGAFTTADGCDNANGFTCGGAGVPNKCGKACTPATQCPAGMNCGVYADGCGGVVSCGGSCTTGTCGGGNEPNVCGSSSTCTGLCTQQITCPDNGTTSISGTVTAPNGDLPIYGALVFVPTAPPAPFAPGVSCDQCGASAGTPLVSTTTGPDGKFLLPNMPVSDPDKVTDIPVVIQLGRWRKQITVATSACTNTVIPAVDAAAPTKLVGGASRPSPDHVTAALPRNKADGDIPLTAISTGYIDGLECVFRKLGIDHDEFTNPSGDGRIRFYQDNGAVITPPVGACSVSGESCTNYGGNCTATCSISGESCSNVGNSCGGYCSNRPSRSCDNIGSSCGGNRGTCQAAGTCTSNGVCNQTSGTPHVSTLYNDPDELAKYDMTIFECVGSEVNKSKTQKANIRNYANSGGRVYATHYSYVWLYDNDAAPWNATASFAPKSHAWDTAIAALDTSFAKGQAFAQWLNLVGGLNSALPAGGPPWASNPPKITINDARHDVNGPVADGAQRWLYTTTADSPKINSVQHYTFNTDFTKPASEQCGRVLFSDFHVTTSSDKKNQVFPNECGFKCSGGSKNNQACGVDADCPGGTCKISALTSQEKVLAFMLFDLASCVSEAPPPTSCEPLSCEDQGIECGQTGDGCGNVITCANCPEGQTCGGGGTPNKCGASTCTKATCPTNACGQMGDGCGGMLDCGDCTAGTCGGGGVANTCGAGTCTPDVCPAPAPGSKCGPVADGCGALLSCQCPDGYSCINGKCATSTCVKRTCEKAGANCGKIADGCGGMLDCGNCLAPQSCGGGGLANVCGGGVN